MPAFPHAFRCVAALSAALLCGHAAHAANALLVVASTSLNSEDSARKTALEGWGYTVTVIDDGESQSDFNDALGVADVVYVSENAAASQVQTKLRETTVGVVSEQNQLDDDFGFATSANTVSSGTGILITNTSHAITSGLSTGNLVIYSTAEPIGQMTGTLGSGVTVLATEDGEPGFAIIETGGALANTVGTNSTASGRRVRLPAADRASYNFTSLNATGLQLFQDAVAWAASTTSPPTPSTPIRVLMVVVDTSPLTTAEQARKTTFESWGCTVNLIDQSDPQATFDAAFEENDVVWITEEVQSGQVSYKVREAEIGVVSGEVYLDDEMGFSTTGGSFVSANQINIITNSHPITSGLSTGTVTYATSSQDAQYLSATAAPGFVRLGSFGSLADFGAIEKGGQLANSYNGSSVAFGRRVRLPWGWSSFDWTTLNSNGLRMAQQALWWAASDGLVGHWKLDETTGTLAADSSFYANDGTLSGTADWDAAVRGNGHDFDGADGDDYIEIPNSDSLEHVTEGSYTVAAWFRPDSVPSGTGATNTANYAIIMKPGYHGGLRYDNGRHFAFDHWLSNNAQIVAGVWQEEFPPGRYYHVAGVVDTGANEVRLYVDGELKSTATLTSTSAYDYGSEPWRIGIASPGASSYRWAADGEIDDARVYDRVLTAAEILELYGLVGHWRLDEASGTTAADSSGLGNDGTYVGGPTLGSSGVRGRSAGLDGVDDSIAIPGHSSLDATEGVAVAAWAKSDGATWSNYASFLCKREQVILTGNPGGTAVTLWVHRASGGWTSLQTVVDSITEWRQYAGLYDAATGEMQVYVDGELAASKNLGAGTLLSSDTTDLSIGYDEASSGRYMSGYVDDVVLYNRAMTDSEIAEHYGLMGHWALDESSGTAAADSSGLSNDGVYQNGPTLGETGIRGVAATLNTSDTNDRIDLPNGVLDGASTVSVAWWMKTNNSGVNAFFSAANSGNANELYLAFASGNKLWAYTPVGAEGHDVGTYADDKWRHFCYLLNLGAGVEQVYVDGALVSQKAFTPTTDPFEVDLGGLLLGQDQDSVGGGFSSSETMQGTIDDVVVYNRAMTPAEIAEHYGLVGHWKFDESSGVTAADSSLMGNDATFSTGDPAWITGKTDGALDFDGGDDAQTDDTFDPPGTGAVSFWFRPQNNFTSSERLFGIADDWEVRADSFGYLVFDLGATSVYHFETDDYATSAGSWHHMVGMFDADADTYELYGDGVLLTSGSLAIAKQSAGFLSFGTRTGSTERFAGALDDLRIYNRWLTADEISDLHSNTTSAGLRIMKWVEIR